MEEIRLFDLNKEKYENYILKKKIIIICVIGIIVILNIINFLTKKILGLYIPLFSMALIPVLLFQSKSLSFHEQSSSLHPLVQLLQPIQEDDLLHCLPLLR